MKTLSNFICVVVIFVLFLLTLPQSNFASSSCPVEGQTMSKVELYFGLNIPGGGKVEPLVWQKFIDNVISPRFPDGLSIDKISGQWRDAKTDKTIQEESRMVMILYKRSAKAEQAIEDIRAAYKSQFQQDSVMRLDEINCVSF
ncbi:MAG: DUF3574 domain-containing protein [Moorea sp. SIO3C2]|nr:DUF3574 domain-containing protein [Moorena sp. SIO3C2]